MSKERVDGDVTVALWAPFLAVWLLFCCFSGCQACAARVSDYPRTQYRFIVHCMSIGELMIAIFTVVSYTSDDQKWSVFIRFAIGYASIVNGFCAYKFGTSNVKMLFRGQRLEEPPWLQMTFSSLLVLNTFGVVFGWFLTLVLGNTLPIYVYWLFADTAVAIACIGTALALWPVLSHVNAVIANAQFNKKARLSSTETGAADGGGHIGKQSTSIFEKTPTIITSHDSLAVEEGINTLRKARIRFRVIIGVLALISTLTVFSMVAFNIGSRKQGHLNDHPYPNKMTFIAHFLYSVLLQTVFISWVYQSDSLFAKDSIFAMCCLPMDDDLVDDSKENTSRFKVFAEALSLKKDSSTNMRTPAIDSEMIERRRTEKQQQMGTDASVLVSVTPHLRGTNTVGVGDDDVYDLDSCGISSGVQEPTQTAAATDCIPPPELMDWQKSAPESAHSVCLVIMEWDGVFCKDTDRLIQFGSSAMTRCTPESMSPYFYGAEHVKDMHEFFEAVMRSPRLALEERMQFYLVCQHSEKHIELLLDKMDFRRLFDSGQVVCKEHAIFQQGEANVNRIVMKIISNLDIAHERVLYVGCNHDTIEHFKKIHVCNAFESSLKEGLSGEARRHLLSKYF